jgi:hypothetical protein
MDNLEKLATLGKKTLENTDGAIKNGQSRETGNIREYRRGNQKWAIQRNWQYRVHKTKKNKTKTQRNIRI